MKIDTTTPTIVNTPSWVISSHTKEDNSSEQSHMNAAATKMIMRIGSCAMVITNMANGGPNTRKIPPKNSAIVIVGLMWHVSVVCETE